ncbi:mycofactocin dehydrogenase MftG [Tomitella biformata]|uniref:mycofactocin dehydrogenase MftG n=1 Tax=Tomitella biformata TaxID=630403 RepID=UPI00056E3364|nr:mycofactocin system GMC family oxidoreductase MftG [Tomitella biformata]
MDLLIVGGGSCGAVLAARLSADPTRRVLLVESGPGAAIPERLDTLPIGPGSYRTTMYDAQLSDTVTTTLVRGRGVGGSGAVNGGYFMRGAPTDFADWGSGLWTYEQVLPFYRRLEHDHDFGGPGHGGTGPMPIRRVPRERWHPLSEAFAQAALDAGLPWEADKNGGLTAGGIGPVPLNMDELGHRIDTATCYLEGRPNLEVRTNTTIRRLVIRAGAVAGVETADGAVINADKIILCAGGIGSALIMLRSNLTAGQTFSDHPEVAVPYVPSQPAARGHPLLEATLNLGEDLELRPYTASFGDAVPGNPPMPPHVGVALMSPRSRGQVTVDADGGVHIKHGYLQDPADKAIAAHGVALAQELIRTSGIGTPLEPVLGTSQHLSGSCAMGNVVDERLKSLEVDSLWIADTSVFPRIPSRGPHATAVMLAERAAELIG